MKYLFLSLLLLCANTGIAQNYIAPYGIQASIGSSQNALLRLGAPIWKGIGIGASLYNLVSTENTQQYKPHPNVSGEIFYSTRLRQSRFHLYSAVAFGYLNYKGILRSFPNPYDVYQQNQYVPITGDCINFAANTTYEIILPKGGENRSFYTTILPIFGVAYNTANIKSATLATTINTAYLNMGVGFRFIANGFHFGVVSEYHYSPERLRELAITLAIGGKI